MLNNSSWKIDSSNQIPNHKNQITNKSQISISSDQNIHHSYIASFCGSGSTIDYAIGQN
ncbi:hypothetical protein D1AOALGA4SA_7025 [Olavius algarvensis Delta 1 endosymbiont]|nr:hypothetical protein D1AOALGA4SA_7025 [Olavius algarvensis Delta 1 endosymbiont]